MTGERAAEAVKSSANAQSHLSQPLGSMMALLHLDLPTRSIAHTKRLSSRVRKASLGLVTLEVFNT